MTESRRLLSVMVLHGPNLNLLGTREPDVYGTLTLEEVDRRIADRAASKGIQVRSFQSNIEGELVDAIQDATRWADGIVINAAGYSHTSVAIRDAIAAVDVPAVAVHLSNPAAREEFRHSDLVAGVCWGVISGFGWVSYVLALDVLADRPARGSR